MTTKTLTDGLGQTFSADLNLALDRQAAGGSKSVAACTEDRATNLAILAAVDGVEALLATIDGRVDGLETLIGTTNSSLATIDTRVDGVETLLGTANTSLSTLTTQGASTADVGVESHTLGDFLTVTPTLDTSIYASGDVLFTTTAVTNSVRANDGIAQLQSVVVVDKDDQKPEFALKFWSSNVSYGTINAVPSISDSDAANCLGRVNITASDYDDDGGVSTAFKDNIGKFLKAASGTRTIYVTGKLTAGTPTHTASGLVIRLGLVWG